jgi:hypothetical protein
MPHASSITTGRKPRSAAWHAVGSIPINLTRAVDTLGSTRWAPPSTPTPAPQTIRAQLIAVPARLARSPCRIRNVFPPYHAPR